MGKCIIRQSVAGITWGDAERMQAKRHDSETFIRQNCKTDARVSARAARAAPVV